MKIFHPTVIWITFVLAAPSGSVKDAIHIQVAAGSDTAFVKADNGGQVVRSSLIKDSPVSKFLYTSGVGSTGINGIASLSFSSSDAFAVSDGNNNLREMLSSNGLLVNPGEIASQILLPGVSANDPNERVTFGGLNDAGSTSGYSPSTNASTSQPASRGFLDTPGGAVGNGAPGDPRSFQARPSLVDNAGNIMYFASLTPFTNIVTIRTGCGLADNSLPVPEGCTPDANTTRPVPDNVRFAGTATRLNDSREVVMTLADMSRITAPMLLSGGQVIDVNTLFPTNSGQLRTDALDIDNSGQIAGTGTPNGIAEALLSSSAAAPVTVPEPSGAVLCASVALLVILRRKSS